MFARRVPRRHGRGRFGLVLALTVAVSAGGLTPVVRAAEASHELKPLWERKVSRTEAVTGLGAKTEMDRAAAARKKNEAQAKTAESQQEAAWPQGGESRLNVSSAGIASTARVGGLPVAFSAPKTAGAAKSTKAPAEGQAQVRVLDHRAAVDLGIKGVVLSAKASQAGVADVRVGYGEFAAAYGGGWSGRLGLFRLPECALTTPEKAECRTTTEVASFNDISEQSVTGTVTLSASAPTALALAATTSGESASGSGTYAATQLSPSATWEAGASSGAFTWAYPMTTPPAAGPAPSLSLGYDSGSVDGKTASTNNQSTQVGEGFELSANSYVERTYGACDDDGQTDKFDLCWKMDNASLVLNGKASELVKDDTTGTWRLKNDDASTVTLSTGADNGDNNGEHWTVTTGDGTRYVFGLNKLPGAANERTNSVWTVPVFGDDAGEPGYDQGSTFAGRAVTQAWRWNLDYVEDLHDNAMSYWYTKESNSYAKNDASTATASYTRGGYLTKSLYGQRAGSLFAGVTTGKVEFTYTERCTATDCSNLTDSTAPNWPDVPFDSVCAANADCDATGPTFFSRKRMTRVDTFVWSATSSDFTPVDTWELTQQYLDGGDIGDSTDQTLTLKSVKHTGKNGTAIGLNPVTFTYDMRPNRVDGDRDDILPLNKPRIRTVTSETGAVVDVTLSGQECVRGSSMPTAEDDNSKSCYPQYWHINGAEDASIDWFHKYRVTAVVTSDPTGHSATMESQYVYSGPAWHYNDSPFTPADERSWSLWHGYRTVTVTQGVGSNLSKVTSVYLQGMDGDRLLKADGTLDPTARRTATVAGVDFNGLDVADQKDSEPYSGFLREQITYNGTTPVAVTVNDPWSKRTATQHKSYADTEAYYVRTGKTATHTYLTVGQSWRSVSGSTTYDDYGMPVKIDNAGDTAKTGDETCTRSWYARNTDLGINSLTSRTRTVGRACSVGEADLSLPSNAASAGDVISDIATVYDSSTATAWTAAQTPSKGEATWTGRAAAYPAGVSGSERNPSSWQTVGKATFDTLGRALTATDAAGNTTATTYTPTDTGPVTRTQVKNAKGYSTYTYLDPGRGQPTKVFDPNNRTTETSYDALGRNTALWLPNRSRSAGQSASYEFDYSVSNTAPSWTSTGTLKADGNTYSTSYTIFDSLLRPLQTQSPGATSGRILTDTRYDSRGLAYETYADIFDAAAPSGTYTQTEYGEAPSLTKTGYDAAGRPVTNAFLVGGVQKWQTTTTYTGDTIATSAVDGDSAARTLTDALGRTVEIRQYSSTSPADSEYGGSVGADYTRTRFTYTPDGKQKTITGPDSAVWSYTFDLYGRQIAASDPDTGTTTTGYTALDQVSWTKGSTGQAVISAYDPLGRTTDTWKATAGADLTNPTVLAAQKTDANKLTHLTYDTVTSGKGQPATSTRYTGGATGKAYTQSVTAYDSRYHVTGSSLTLPSDDPLVTSGALASNTLNFSAYYNIDGTLQYTDEPAAGGLAAETVRYSYSDRGLPTTLTGGSKGIVLNTAYTDLGQVSTLQLGVSEATGTNKIDIANGWEDGTHRLTQTQVHATSHAYDALNLHYGYDDAGNVTKISDTTTLAGTGKADTQCFAYDGYQRLTEAWTPADADCAPENRTTANLGGAAPYWAGYTYNSAGQRVTETTHGSGSTTTTTSCYKQGSTQPHTLLATITTGTCTNATAAYAYDAGGNTTKRPDGSATQKLDWNDEGKLSRLTEDPNDTARTTDYIYGPDGNLLIRRNAASDGETVLYLGVTEVHLKAGQKWANRYYAYAGSAIALRSNQSGTEKISYLSGDRHGTSTTAITSDTQALTKRYLTPFGKDRGMPLHGPWPDDKGFLGKSADSDTGLTHIAAREYDPALGQFLSVDPLLAATAPQSLNGYSYAAQNPVTHADPTGLCRADQCGVGVPKGDGSGEIITDGPIDPGNPSAGSCHKGSCGPIQYNDTSGTATTGSSGQGSGGNEDCGWLSACGWSNAWEDTKHWVADNKATIAQVVTEVAVGGACYATAAGTGLATGGAGFAIAAGCGAVAGAAGAAVGNALAPEADHSAAGQLEDQLDGAIWGAAASVVGSGLASVGAKTAGRILGKCHSFLPGTGVLLADGKRKAIEDVEVGDVVVTTDTETGETVEKTVVDTITTEDDKDFTELTVATNDGVSSIAATDTHPFWVPRDHEWIKAGDLHPGQWLRTSSGTHVQITAVSHYTKRQRTHDLTIEDIHAYYVLAGVTPVLVHNCKTVVENQAGRFGDMDPGVPGDGLTPHHMPQDALGHLPRRDGGAIVMKHADHALTRTYGPRGRATKAAEAGLPFRTVLARDIWDLRRIGQQQYGDPGYYNQGIQDLLAYYRSVGLL
ncbi:polymorphic toxin-type HINT domain-containing protein [Streptomyces chartreusis]|uniref:polymorphic toxin-type HINT domain-containing protein n=1 Tax=Streptomyces chartreusis TaxID=1969 RepID=UPI003D8DDFE3